MSFQNFFCNFTRLFMFINIKPKVMQTDFFHFLFWRKTETYCWNYTCSFIIIYLWYLIDQNDQSGPYVEEGYASLFTNLCNKYSSAMNSCAIDNATTHTNARTQIYLYFYTVFC